MNTRFVVTTKSWFGGGADLTPVLDRRRTQQDPDTVAFHAAMQAACEAHNAVADYDKLKKWCDEYSICPIARNRAASAAYFRLARLGRLGCRLRFHPGIGRAFLEVYPKLVRRNFKRRGRRKTARSN